MRDRVLLGAAGEVGGTARRRRPRRRLSSRRPAAAWPRRASSSPSSRRARRTSPFRTRASTWLCPSTARATGRSVSLDPRGCAAASARRPAGVHAWDAACVPLLPRGRRRDEGAPASVLRHAPLRVDARQRRRVPADVRRLDRRLASMPASRSSASSSSRHPTPRRGTTTTRDHDPEWSRSWPSEEIWIARKTG